MKADVGLIGPLNVDLLIRGEAPREMNELTKWAGPSDVALSAAGSAGYIAQDLVRFGLKTSLLSILADDAFGDGLLRILKEAGLNLEQVSRQPGTLSGIGIYMLLFGSRKRPLTYRLPTHDPWPNPITKEQRAFLLEQHRHIHCAGYLHFPTMWNDDVASLFRAAKQKGLSTSLDPQFVLYPIDTPWMEPLAELLKSTDLLILDEDEASQITGEYDVGPGLETLRAAGAKVVVIKRGARGSAMLADDRLIEAPAVEVPVGEIADTIGAGDAFDTGMIYGLLNGWTMERSQRFANLVAASTLRAPGGTESLAPLEQLLKLLGT